MFLDNLIYEFGKRLNMLTLTLLISFYGKCYINWRDKSYWGRRKGTHKLETCDFNLLRWYMTNIMLNACIMEYSTNDHFHRTHFSKLSDYVETFTINIYFNSISLRQSTTTFNFTCLYYCCWSKFAKIQYSVNTANL